MKQYRNKGAVGALLDEYEKTIIELQSLIENISTTQLTSIVDTKTKDQDCISIQSILTHVIQSGYQYVIAIRKHLGEPLESSKNNHMKTVEEYISALDQMFMYNETLFIDYPDIELEEHDPNNKIITRWGQYYDVEQLFEHAIVHVLRHRRQIEIFLNKLN